ncbi:PAAR domain-containing protein [Polyangium aurulentum]|uniref:PAAR domain-containing protein n=1 Tax=Polyangium aurulentum TaxID=2567896 RepID=UPI0010AE9E7B|nr:PAAR domain-containing protein [Polyangium aurulentum]UQA58626.1 PAAR domain-containing protein [Polyangium aurulentum]
MPPAARITDRHNCAKHPPNAIVSGEGTVIVGFQPQARVSDEEACGATISAGEKSVIIGFKDAARKGDPTSHGGVIASGCPTVIIGSNPITDKPFYEDCKKKDKEQEEREKAGRGSP